MGRSGRSLGGIKQKVGARRGSNLINTGGRSNIEIAVCVLRNVAIPCKWGGHGSWARSIRSKRARSHYRS